MPLPYGGKDLARAFRTVRRNTLTLVEEIPDDKLDFTPAKGARSVRALLAHIAFGDEFASEFHRKGRTSFEGLDFPAMMQRLAAEEAKPRDKAALTALLSGRGADFSAWLESLGDEFLTEAIPMPPGDEVATKTRLEMLMSAKEHEMHHRGQLMLIVRQLGQVPPLTREREAMMAAHGNR